MKILEGVPVDGFSKEREDIKRKLLDISCSLEDVVTVLSTVDYNIAKRDTFSKHPTDIRCCVVLYYSFRIF